MTKLQLSDPHIGVILRAKLKGCKPSRDSIAAESPATRNLWLKWDSLVISNGVLYVQNVQRDKTVHFQLALPSVLIPRVLKSSHNSQHSAHLGVKKTSSKIKCNFHWYKMKFDVRNWIRQCEMCGARKLPSAKPSGRMNKYVVGYPLDRIATDILGPFPILESGNKYILVVMDQFTKFVEVYAIPDQTAERVAEKIVFEFISRYGVPLEMHSDQGRNFESVLFQEVCRLLEVHKTRTTPFHPASNDMVEKFNSTLLNMITTYVNDEQDNWDKCLNLVTSAYRACAHESTGYTPNMLMFGREVHLPIALEMGVANDEMTTSTVEYVQKLKDKMDRIYCLVRTKLGKSFSRYSKSSDSRISGRVYNAGDLVYCRDSTKTVGKSPKLKAHVWRGPYLVIRRINDLLYEIKMSQKKATKVLHYERLKPYAGTNIPDWLYALREKVTSGQIERAANRSGSTPELKELQTGPVKGPAKPMSGSRDVKRQQTVKPPVRHSLR